MNYCIRLHKILSKGFGFFLTSTLICCFIFINSSGCAHVVHKKVQANKKIGSSGLKATVVIDPGHGGEDAGAVSRRGLKEKDVTLDVAKRVARLFSHLEPDVQVILTRTKDQFVSLEERIQKAHRHQGDIFVSLHINSSESKDARGFEIYSLDVASDRHAERLANRENKEIHKKNKPEELILADLRAFSYRKQSDTLANYITLGLKKELSQEIPQKKLLDRGYNQAIFHVLFVKMPAVLTELFFLSNPEEEQLLSKKMVRERAARGIFLGIKKYLIHRGLYASKS